MRHPSPLATRDPSQREPIGSCTTPSGTGVKQIGSLGAAREKSQTVLALGAGHEACTFCCKGRCREAKRDRHHPSSHRERLCTVGIIQPHRWQGKVQGRERNEHNGTSIASTPFRSLGHGVQRQCRHLWRTHFVGYTTRRRRCFSIKNGLVKLWSTQHPTNHFHSNPKSIVNTLPRPAPGTLVPLSPTAHAPRSELAPSVVPRTPTLAMPTPPRPPPRKTKRASPYPRPSLR